MSSGPDINVDRFRHRPDSAVTALLPDPRRVDEALGKGEALVTVPCPPATRYDVGHRLIALGGHAVIYTTGTTAETLTPP